jgi:outer membrane receptor protein involved in Fe transport
MPFNATRWSLACGTAMALALAAAPSAVFAQAAYQFDLPPQPLADALRAVGTKASVTVAFNPATVSGKSAPALKGAYPAQAAIEHLISGAGLRVRITAAGSFLVEPSVLQPAADASTVSAEVGEVLVTGSRTGKMNVPTPVMNVSAATLREGAPPNYVAALTEMPQFKASWSPQITGGSFAAASYGVDLRGLGSSRTLLLLEGRRLGGSYSNGTTQPDLAIIPSLLIDRIDVVTGSASAAWGSNAVAGVVNVVLNNQFEGVKLGARAGTSSRSDAQEKQVEGAGGFYFSGGKGHVLVGGEFVDNDGARPKTARENVGRWVAVPNPDFTATNGQMALIFAPDVGAANASLGGLILNGVNAGKAFNPDGTLSTFNLGRVSGTNSIGGDGPSNDDFSYLAAPSTRYSGMGRVSYQMSDAIKLTADVLHSRTYNDFSFLPDRNLGNLAISVNNAFLPQAIRSQMAARGETSFTFGRYNADFALMRNDFSRRTTQGGVVLDADLGGTWRANGYVTYARYRETVDISNLRVTTNFANAVDSVISPTTNQPVCRVALADPATACVPINLFGEGAPSQQARNYVLGTGHYDSRTSLGAGGVTLRGEPVSLWAGPVSVALGAEARRETINQQVGPIDQVKGFAFSNFTAYSGHNATKEAFGEVLAPLVRDAMLFNLLQFNGAARYTNDQTGSIWSWKLGLTDDVIDGIRLRFAHSRDIRAPNLAELNSPQTFSLVNISDPQTNTTYQVRQFAGGNPGLVPETSLTTTVGFSITPSLIRNLTASVDYFDIDIANAIGTIPAQSIVSLCAAGSSTACGAITRGAGNLITQTSVSQLNFTNLQTSGFDGSIAYRIPVSDTGTVYLRSNVTWTQKYKTNNGLTTVDFLGSQGTTLVSGVPKVRINTSVHYEQGRFEATLRNRFISAGVNNITQQIQNNRIPAYAYFDLGLRYRIPNGGRELELFANVNNMFDKAPPIASQTSPYYDVIGRYFSAGARISF